MRFIATVFILIIATGTNYSQESNLEFNYTNSSYYCNPFVDDIGYFSCNWIDANGTSTCENWKPTHGSPRVYDVYGQNSYDGGALLQMTDNGDKTEGLFIPYPFIQGRKYNISIFLMKPSGYSSGLKVCAANNLNYSYDSNCLEETTPSNSSNEVIFEVTGINNAIGNITQHNVNNWQPTNNYSQLWISSKQGYYSTGSIAVHHIIVNDMGLVDEVPPTVPVFTIPTNVTYSRFTARWNPSTDNTGVSGYKVQLNGGTNNTTTSTSYTFTGLLPSTTYQVSVCAFDANGNQSEYASTSITTDAPDVIPPTVPTNLVATNIGETSFTLNWTASTDNYNVIKYKIFKDGVLLQSNVSSTSFLVNNLADGVTYRMQVSAYDESNNQSGLSVYLDVTTVEIDRVPPTVPVLLPPSNVTHNQFTLRWNPSTDNVGVVGYQIYSNGILLQTTTNTFITIGGLAECQNNYMQVKAFDARPNFSDFSPVQTTQTTANIPSVIVLNTNHNGQGSVTKTALTEIKLQAGFQFHGTGTTFRAYISNGCQKEPSFIEVDSDGLEDGNIEELSSLSDDTQTSPGQNALANTEQNSVSQYFELKLYPNPTHKEAFLEVNTVPKQVSVYNSQGQMLFSITPNDIKTSIDLNGYPEGLYFVKIDVNGEIFVEKLLLK